MRLGGRWCCRGEVVVMGKHTEMDKDAAARIQSAGARNPDSPTAASGFYSRAQSSADRHEVEEERSASEDGEDG
jgi:hypothetical protein